MPNGYMQGSNGQLIEIIDAAARERLAKTLPAPETVTAGYYLRINAVNADGSFTVEAVPEPSGSGAELPSTAKFETLAIGAADADGVCILSDGTADAPTLDLYGEQGDERVRLRNLAEAVDDSDAPTLAQVRDMVGNGSGENVNGLTTAQINALDGMFKIASFTEDPTEAYSAFKTAFGISDSGGSDS